MRGKSHLQLGEYLVEHYMPQAPKLCVRAFLLGCIQPDRNPTTYLKGSFRYQWLRGHNYHNAKKFMIRLSSRLEQREKRTVLDYYSLGKLIHYTADAFTFAHNAHFPEDLTQHCIYEAKLQNHFLKYLQTDPKMDQKHGPTIMEIIRIYHREYSEQEPSIHTDTVYILNASCSILTFLFAKQAV